MLFKSIFKGCTSTNINAGVGSIALRFATRRAYGSKEGEDVANKAHVKVLKKGTEVWNKWRKEKPETEIDLRKANLHLADLSAANLSGANLRRADLSRTNLSGAVLSAANFSAAKLVGANLSETDLSGADLSGARLDWAKLSRANLSGAHLSKANLSGAHLNQVDLSGAFLGNADLSGAILYRADLHDADLSGANLFSADLRGADLREADLSEAEVSGTRFAGVDLSQTKGLETVYHLGPSEISISTIYLSQGKIPFEFLRGAGVPDNFIEYMHSLTGTAFEFYSCFISYSSKDQPFAERIYADLQANGVRCWFAPHDAHSGQKLHQQIDQAIRLHEKLLLILSTDSMKSEWVKTEIKKAAKRQSQEKKDVLFPVSLAPFDELREWECFDGDLGRDLGAEIREYLIPDFSRWKEHDHYQTAFAKLLRDLRSGKTKTG